MKKFSKLLILLLALVAIVTAFTVVALAADGEVKSTLEPLSLNTNTHYADDFDHEDYDKGYEHTR